jgi:hypothetical protein
LLLIVSDFFSPNISQMCETYCNIWVIAKWIGGYPNLSENMWVVYDGSFLPWFECEMDE